MQTSSKPSRRYFCFPATNEVEGPFELTELAGLLHDKLISGETPVLTEGEELWLPFQERPEYNFAREIPREAVARHAQEKEQTHGSAFTPRRILTCVGIMSPVFLYILYRFVRMYLVYHFVHQE